MSDTHSTLSQLVKAYKTHYKYSNVSKEEISHLLLLFYAVECALKAMYLKNFNGLSTRDLHALFAANKHGLNNKFGHTHDIWKWSQTLKLPNLGYTKNDEELYPINEMHERLRYGTFSTAQHDLKKVKFLKDLASLLKDKV